MARVALTLLASRLRNRTGLNTSFRRGIGFRYHDTVSPFGYELVRQLYLRMRNLEVAR